MKTRPMMINRRKALLAMVGTWAAGVSNAAFGRLLTAVREPSSGSPGPLPSLSAGDPVEKALREDLARLGSRAYSDEGIPVFLACEDLVAVKGHRPAVPASALSRSVADDLRKNGEAWLRIYPEAPAADISKLIEVLAERDFRRGATGETS